MEFEVVYAWSEGVAVAVQRLMIDDRLVQPLVKQEWKSYRVAFECGDTVCFPFSARVAVQPRMRHDSFYLDIWKK